MVVKTKKQDNEKIELKPGCYYVTLQEPYEEEINGEIVIKFPFSVNGIVGKIKPFYFYLFKAKDDDDKLKIQRLDTLEMAIRECFNTMLPFTKNNYKMLKGKKGRVVIGKHRNGKMGVVFFMQNEMINLAHKALSENTRVFKNELL